MIKVTEHKHSGQVLNWTAVDKADFCARATNEGRQGPDYTGDPDSDFESVKDWLASDLVSLEVVEE